MSKFKKSCCNSIYIYTTIFTHVCIFLDHNLRYNLICMQKYNKIKYFDLIVILILD